jgi:hypothetical protein
MTLIPSGCYIVTVRFFQSQYKQKGEKTMTNKEKMNSDRKTARIVGVLFITATVAGTLSAGFSGPIHAPDYLIDVSAKENQVIMAALFSLIMGAAVAGIAVTMYPIFKKHNEALALGYVVSRVLEAATFIAVVISWLLLLILSQEYVKAGAPDVSYYQTLGELLRAVGDWVGHVVLDVAVVSLGYLMFYYLLYQSKLTPRWLSVWGLIAAPLWLAAGFLALFGEDPLSTISILLNLPIAVNEMVLAVWLIVKGFNPSAIASGFTETDINRA